MEAGCGEVEDDGKRKMREMGIGCQYKAGLGVVDWIGGEGGCGGNEMRMTWVEVVWK